MALPLLALALMGGNLYAANRQGEINRANAAEDRSYMQRKRQEEVDTYDRARKLQTDLGNAGAPATVQNGASMTGLAGSTEPAVYTDPNVAASDLRQDQVMARMSGNQPANAAATPATVASAPMMPAQTFADRGAADKAVTAYNTPQAQIGRMSDVYMRNGNPVAAQQLRTGARQEQVADLQVKQAFAEDKNTEALREMGTLLAKGGADAIPEIYKRYNDGHDATVQKDPKGEGFTVTQVGQDGKGVGSQHFGSKAEFFSLMSARFDPQKWLTREDAQAKQKATEQHQAEQLKQQAEQHKETNQTTLKAAQIHAGATIQAARERRAGSEASAGNKGWVNYKDKDNNLYRFNANAGLVEKKLPTGEWEQSAELPEGLTKLGAMAGGGALNARFAGRVNGAANEGLAAINSIAKLSDPNSGLFSAKGMSGADGKNIVAGLLTPERVKRYNGTMAGLAIEIATAQNQGMVPHEQQIADVKQAITIGPTDDDVTKRYRVALAARYLRKALEVSQDLANPDQKKRAEGILKDLEKIPDPDEIETQNKGKGMFPKAGASGRRSSSPAAESPAKTPSGATVSNW